MPTPDPADASLINDAEFLNELERSEHRQHDAPDAVLESHEYGDALDALESGLPMQAGAGQAGPRAHDRELAPIAGAYEPIENEYDAPEDEPLTATAERGISFLTAAMVIVGCLTVGAATAALVFHDRVAQITSTRTATR